VFLGSLDGALWLLGSERRIQQTPNFCQ
jgi:hypothetical protein